nr:uncharacterized protein LOC129262819 [Lytechinus pictus]
MAQDRFVLIGSLVCCLGVVSIAALVLGIISITSLQGTQRESTNDPQSINIYTQPSTGSSPDNDDDKIWMFAISHYDDKRAYLDKTTHTIRGFTPDIVEAVCEIANKNCVTVYDISANCWDSKAGERPRGGKGIMSGWYDGCLEWVQTYDRLLTFTFSAPYTKGGTVGLFVKNDSFVTYDDLTNQKVGFIDGWNSDEFCLARYTNIMGSTLRPDQVFYFETADLLAAAVQNDVVDVAFGEVLGSFTSSLKRISPLDFENNCRAAGGSVMTRHTNTDLVNWWNDAFQLLNDRGRYNEICDSINERHGHIPSGDYREFCIGY